MHTDKMYKQQSVMIKCIKEIKLISNLYQNN